MNPRPESPTPNLRHLFIQDDRQPGRPLHTEYPQHQQQQQQLSHHHQQQHPYPYHPHYPPRQQQQQHQHQQAVPDLIDRRSSGSSPRLVSPPDIDRSISPHTMAPSFSADRPQYLSARERQASQTLLSLVHDRDRRSPSNLSDSLSVHSDEHYRSGLTAPMSAPLVHNGSGPYFQDMRRPSNMGPGAHRPDIYRRHSSHPYDHHSRPGYQPQIEYPPVNMGTRMPISRTTKACNACRSRKVRCDAGANNPGNVTGEPSQCSRCREAGVSCVYSGVQKKRGPCPGTARPVSTAIRRQPSHSELRPEQPQLPQHRPISPTEPVYVAPRGSYPGPHVMNGPSRSFPAPVSASPHPPAPYHHLAHRPSVDDWQRPRTGREPAPYHTPPPVPQHSQVAHPEPPRQPSIVHSWPVVDPPPHAVPRPQQRKPFHSDFSLPSPPPSSAMPEDRRGSYFGDQGRSLPPLRLAISGRPSFFEA